MAGFKENSLVPKRRKLTDFFAKLSSREDNLAEHALALSPN